MQTVDDIKPCYPLFRNDDYKQTISNKRATFEEMHAKEKIDETFKWTTSQEYQELNFKREALTINPAKACQPLGSSLCGLGFHKTLASMMRDPDREVRITVAHRVEHGDLLKMAGDPDYMVRRATTTRTM